MSCIYRCTAHPELVQLAACTGTGTHSRFLDSLTVAKDRPKVAPMMRMHTKAWKRRWQGNHANTDVNSRHVVHL
jgi:hypothetical protein